MDLKQENSIMLSNCYEMKDHYFDQNPAKDDTKLRLLTESIFQIKESEPKYSKFIIKDIGEKKENYNLIENYVGCYRMYAISFVDEFNNPVIKCFRRFSHFDSFLTKLKMTFPYLIIPKTPHKNPLTKVRLVEERFFEERERKLQFIINYINRNEILSNSREFNKLINEFEFDFAYFSKTPSFNVEYLFPELDRLRRGNQTNYFGFFNKLIYKDYVRFIPPEELNLLEHKKYYNELYKTYSNLKSIMIKTGDNFEECKKNEENVYSNFLFFKDFDFIEESDQSELIENFQLVLKKKEEINELNLPAFYIILDKLENFNSILKGLVEALERFELYIDSYKVMEEYLFKNNGGIKNSILEKEVKKGKELYQKFIKNLESEINTFASENSNINIEILNEFLEFLELSNNYEIKLLNIHNIDI